MPEKKIDNFIDEYVKLNEKEAELFRKIRAIRRDKDLRPKERKSLIMVLNDQRKEIRKQKGLKKELFSAKLKRVRNGKKNLINLGKVYII